MSGEELVRTYNLKNTELTKAFCSICGSAMPNMQRKGKLLVVPAGSMDVGFSMRPTKWLVQNLNLIEGLTIVATDDDHSILEIWKHRFGHLVEENKINLLTFSSGTKLSHWTLMIKLNRRQHFI